MDQILEHLRGKSGYNKQGHEVPDPKPMSVEIDIEASMTIEEKVMRAIRSDTWSKKMNQEGKESFEEANDFNIEGESGEYFSPHEEESGEQISYEEGIRSGFIEEIPEERKKAAAASAAALRELRNPTKPVETQGAQK